ncbi:MAG: hypothetical protein MUF81_00575 [Verrucomicrobia bacterium]|jgi:hypothetical protein|nr:hypothetical protein [Verrucomicrobiota bacterium]
MKTQLSLKTIGFLWVVAALFGLLLAGCSTTKKVDWNSRVDSYTYDQAVAEMGPPDKQAKLSDGATVAEWITHRSGGGGMSIGIGGGSYGRHSGMGVGVSQSVGSGGSDRVLRLVFGPDGKLTSGPK